MDNQALSTYKQDAFVIELDGNRLLQREHYDELRAEYEQVVLGKN